MTDLLQLVPYLLGFHPVESAVAVLLRRRRVLLTARVDLGEAVAGLSDHLARISRVHGADGVVLVACTSSPTAARTALESLTCDERLPPVLDAVHVDDGRWRSVLHDAGGVIESGRLAAEAVYAGLVAASDRSHAVAAAQPPPTQRLAALAATTRAAQVLVAGRTREARVADAVDLVSRWPGGVVAADAAVPLEPSELVRLGVLVGDVETRDELIMMLRTDNADAMVACWSEVLTVLPDELAVGPLCLLGLAAWVSGNGALLVRCIERADQCDPGYSLTRLLGQIADQAVPPSAWSRMGGFGRAGSVGEH